MNNNGDIQKVCPLPEEFHYWFYGDAINHGTHIEFKKSTSPANVGVDHNLSDIPIVHVSELIMPKQNNKVLSLTKKLIRKK